MRTDKGVNRGFTLIELLAVIVILAVIALIATPIIIGIIEDSRESAFKSSLYSIFDAAEYRLVQDKNTEFPNEGIDVLSLSMNNNKFVSGTVFKNEQGMYLENVSDGKFCGNGYKNKLEVVKGNCETAAKWFTFDENTGTITEYKQDGPKNIVIPRTINGVEVKRIEDWTFYNIGITKLILSDTITSIGEYAFAGNLIDELNIPNSVVFIGGGAFTDNKLPDAQAFIYARNSDGTENKTILNSYAGIKKDNVVIPENVLEISTFAFYCAGITSITIPNGLIKIGVEAFNYNKLTNVIIPNSVVYIGRFAFYQNQLTSVTIPNSVTTIEDSAFSNNKLTSVKIIGKSSSKDFTKYGTTLWGWAPGYSDSNIIWNAVE